MSRAKSVNTVFSYGFFVFAICFLESCIRGADQEERVIYRTAPSAPRQYPQYQVQPQYYQAPPQNYYQPPNSRSYYNPYDFNQPYGRNPYSDYDQYYVPPAQYYGNEFEIKNKNYGSSAF